MERSIPFQSAPKYPLSPVYKCSRSTGSVPSFFNYRLKCYTFCFYRHTKRLILSFTGVLKVAKVKNLYWTFLNTCTYTNKGKVGLMDGVWSAYESKRHFCFMCRDTTHIPNENRICHRRSEEMSVSPVCNTWGGQARQVSPERNTLRITGMQRPKQLIEISASPRANKNETLFQGSYKPNMSLPPPLPQSVE